MQIAAFVVGIACLFAVLLDAFPDDYSAAPSQRSLPAHATLLYRDVEAVGLLNQANARFAEARDSLQLLRADVADFLLALWAGVMVLGFALVYYALGSPFGDPIQAVDFRTDLYVSGTTIFTLGLGDVTPHSAWARVFVILESGTGLGLAGSGDGVFSSSLQRIFAARSEHLTVGCAGGIPSNSGGTDETAFL
jgi:hypothetical protein